jgi:hypothetical protein
MTPDYEWLSRWKWRLNADGYVVRDRYVGKSRGPGKVFLSRLIMQPSQRMEVVYLNGNRLDNRRANLRECTRSEKQTHGKLYDNNRSGYRGVSWRRQQGRWIAQIQVNNRKMYLGLFSDRDQAARAYNQAARKYYGDLARLNEV